MSIRTHTLKGRFLALLVSSALGITILFGVLYVVVTSRMLHHEIDNRARKTVQQLALLVEVPLLRQDYVTVVDIIDSELQAGNFRYIWVVDEHDAIIACTDEKQITRKIDPRFRTQRGFQEWHMKEGRVVALLADYSVIPRMLTMVLGGMGAFFLVFLLLFIVLAVRFSRKLTAPLEGVSAAFAEMAAGRFDFTLPESSLREVEMLTLSLQRTGEKLRTLTASLEQETERLRISETNYREIFNSVEDAILIVDPDRGVIVDGNTRMRELFGDGDGFLAMAVPAWREKAVVENCRLFEWPCRDVRGESFWGEIGVHHALIGGRPRLLMVVHDISVRKKAEQTLHETKNYLSHVLDSLSSVLIAVNETGTITQWNAAAERFTGITAVYAQGASLWKVLPPFARYQPDLFQVLHEARPVEFQRQLHQFESKRFLDIAIFPLSFQGERGAVFRVDDVTQLEQKDSQLRQAQKMELVGNLAGGLAHDFNNILGVIVGTISLIRFKMENGMADTTLALRDHLVMIEEAADRATIMVKQLLTLSRSQELQLITVDLNDSIRYVMKICANTVDKSIELRPLYYVQPALVQADPVQIEQVLLNLCINAAHAMTIMRQPEEPRGGVLEVHLRPLTADDAFCVSHPEARRGQTYWIIQVRDNGVGMAPQIIPKIFEPFFSTKEKNCGTGLGLSMVYNLVRQHYGFIDVYSDLGFGSTFNVYLPALEASAAALLEVQRRRSLHMGRGVALVVDDEPAMRRIAGAMLRQFGYEVVTAADGREGVDLFRRQADRLRFVLLDMSMPRMAGREAFLEMHAIEAAVPVFLASGFKLDERVQELLGLGAAGFIQKPYSLHDLSEALNQRLKAD